MRLEEILLKPENTMVLVIDVQNDFLRAESGFSFYDAEVHLKSMQTLSLKNVQSVVEHGIIPLMTRSSGAHIALVKSQYTPNQFPKPYDRLCIEPPGTDFYLIDSVAKNTNQFTKNEHDSFSESKLREFVRVMDIKNIVVAGFTVTTCINDTVTSAFGKHELNANFIIPEDCIGYREERKADAMEILERYASPNVKRVIVTSSQRNIKYNSKE